MDMFQTRVFCLEQWSSTEAENTSSMPNVRTIRKEAHANSEKQTARMMSRSGKKFLVVEFGVNVINLVSDVDQGKTDLPNLIGVVLERTEHDLYRIGTRSGIQTNFIARKFIITFAFTKYNTGSN